MKETKRQEKFRPFIPYHLDDRGRYESQIVLDEHGPEGYGIRQLLRGIFSEYADVERRSFPGSVELRGYEAVFTIKNLAGHCGLGARPRKLIEFARTMHKIFIDDLAKYAKKPLDDPRQLRGFWIVNHDEIFEIPLQKLAKNPASSRYSRQKICIFWPNLLEDTEAVMKKRRILNEKGKEEKEEDSSSSPPPFIQDQNSNGHPSPQSKIIKTCPHCGAALEVKHGPHGKFLSCSKYPSCKYSRALKGKGKDRAQEGQPAELIRDGGESECISLPLQEKLRPNRRAEGGFAKLGDIIANISGAQ